MTDMNEYFVIHQVTTADNKYDVRTIIRAANAIDAESMSRIEAEKTLPENIEREIRIVDIKKL